MEILFALAKVKMPISVCFSSPGKTFFGSDQLLLFKKLLNNSTLMKMPRFGDNGDYIHRLDEVYIFL